MLWFLFASSQAMPVTGDLQLALGETGFNLAQESITAIPIDFQQENISGEYNCWDLVGVRNFNVRAEWEELNFTLGEGTLTVNGTFASVRGEDMIIYTEDEDLLDSCLGGLEGNVEYADINDLEFEIVLSPSINEEGLLAMSVIGDPVVTGNIETDIAWIPDAIILYFFEDALLGIIRDQLRDRIPELVNNYANLLRYSGVLDDFEFSINLEDTTIRSDALLAGADITLAYTGNDPCSSGVPSYNGRDPQFEFTQIPDAHMAFGITERGVNQTVSSLWEDGLFCFSEEDFNSLFTIITDLFDPNIGNLSATANLGEIPVVLIEEDGVRLLIGDARLQVNANGDELLIDTTVDVTGRLDLTINSQISSFGVSVHDIDLHFQSLTVNGLLSDAPYAEEYLTRFLESWVVEEIEQRITNITVYQSVFHEFGFYAFAKEISYLSGGMEGYIDLYNENDPLVDQTPPDTEAFLTNQTENTVSISWLGADNNEGELAFSYKVNDDSWSSWSTASETTLESLLPGEYIVSVKSRDRWWNEDPLPSIVTFSIASPEEDTSIPKENDGNCSGCHSASSSQLGFFSWIFLIGFLRRK